MIKKKGNTLMPIEEVNSKRTREKHSEDSKRAGKRSGEVRRQRKLLKDLFKSLLATPIPQKELKEKIKEMGLSDEEKNYNTLLGMTTLNEALKGNMKAVEFIRDTIGEKPKEEITVNNFNNQYANLTEEELRKLAK